MTKGEVYTMRKTCKSGILSGLQVVAMLDIIVAPYVIVD